MLWCMECSHESGRTFAVLFFGAAAAYPAMISILDGQVRIF